MNEHNMMYAHPLVDQHPLVPTRVMSPNASSSSASGTWLVRSCHCCGDVLQGPAVSCQACGRSVHAHCCTSRAGLVACSVCASEFDLARAQQRAQASAFGFGRALGAGGQLAGHAIGAVATGTIGGAARLVGGAAAGARQAIGGLMASPPPHPVPVPARPRILEEYDI